MKSKIILITGPKHSGKTLCATALGKIMGVEAVDLDDLVEKQTGKSPREIFLQGPEIFRRAEEQTLSSVIRQAKPGRVYDGNQNIRIIAAGGGLVDNNEAMALLHGYSEIIFVFLDVSAETAWQRIQCTAADGELPPFLNTENPKETHLALHERRSGAYKERAHLIIAAENKSPEDIASEIAERLRL